MFFSRASNICLQLFALPKRNAPFWFSGNNLSGFVDFWVVKVVELFLLIIIFLKQDDFCAPDNDIPVSYR